VVFHACAKNEANLVLIRHGHRAKHTPGRTLMSWKTPKIVEVPVGMEINMYACAARK